MRKFFNLLIFFFMGISILFSEQYVLRDIKYIIDGNTRESVLSHYLDIEDGKTFNTKDDLNLYIEEKNKAIRNQRTLSEGSITPFYIIDETNEVVYVDFVVKVKDSWNYVILPYPQYDSNTGLTVGFRAKDYNFLGGMNTLSLSFDYLNLVDGGTEFNIGTDVSIPFYLAGFEWNINLLEDMSISPEAPFKNKTGLGVSVTIPTSSLDWIAEVNQEYFLNQDWDKDDDDSVRATRGEYYLKTSGKVGSKLTFGDISYKPAIITSYPYNLTGDLSGDKRGYKLGLGHSIEYGGLDWLGNFKDGFKLVFDQDLQYNFTREIWVNTQKIDVQYHKYFGWSGLSTRLLGFYNVNSAEEDSNIGVDIRGIRNDRLSGDSTILLNVDFPIKFPIGFFNRWFDAQISPFFDYALVKPKDGDFDITEGWYGSGLEGFAYLNASRSVYMRMSLGFDMEAVFDGTGITEKASRDEAGIWELKIAVGHHY